MAEGRWAAASRRRREAGVESFALIVPMPLLLGVICFPPWFPGLRVASAVGGVALLGVAMVWASGFRRRRERSGRTLQRVTGWARVLALAGLLLGGVGLVLAGPPTVAAASLPANPQVVTPLATDSHCSGRVCTARVTYRMAGREYVASYPASILTQVDASTRFVADPQDPRKAMPQNDFRFGRGAGLMWFALSLATFYGLAAAGAALMLRRDRTRP